MRLRSGRSVLKCRCECLRQTAPQRSRPHFTWKRSHKVDTLRLKHRCIHPVLHGINVKKTSFRYNDTVVSTTLYAACLRAHHSPYSISQITRSGGDPPIYMCIECQHSSTLNHEDPSVFRRAFICASLNSSQASGSSSCNNLRSLTLPPKL